MQADPIQIRSEPPEHGGGFVVSTRLGDDCSIYGDGDCLAAAYADLLAEIADAKRSGILLTMQ